MAQIVSNAFTVQILPAKSSSAVPAWVPPAGYFADVPMSNYPEDLTPAMYRSADANCMNNPFIIWGGSAILRDYSDLGAQVYYSGGHEANPGFPNIQLSLICDFSTLKWSIANLPTAPNLANTFVGGYAPDGTPYCPHTYLGLQEMPKSWGGGPRGTLASFFFAGSTWPNKINLLDVSQAQMGYSQLATRQPQNAEPTQIRFSRNSAGNNYPITVLDEARQGWWANTGGTIDYLLFVSKTGEITQYPALGGNLANGSMVLCDSLNLLVAIDGGYVSGPYAGNGYRTLYVRDLASGAVTRNTTLGDVPALQGGYDGGINNFCRPDTMGLQWVEELGCIVGLDQSTAPPTIVKLTPPATNPATQPWTWSKVTSLQHWPQDVSGHTTLQAAENNMWSKFRWVPSLHAFVFCTAKDRKPQVIKLN
jgi:hypothetical protein